METAGRWTGLGLLALRLVNVRERASCYRSFLKKNDSDGKTGDVPQQQQGLGETSSMGTCRELAGTGQSWSPATDPGRIQAGAATRALNGGLGDGEEGSDEARQQRRRAELQNLAR